MPAFTHVLEPLVFTLIIALGALMPAPWALFIAESLASLVMAVALMP